MTRSTCVAAVVVLAAVMAAPAYADARLAKRTAHRVAVEMSMRTCDALAWCKDYEVVRAARCRREHSRSVFCRITFFTAARDRCGGVVSVSKTRRGRIDRGMAVPMNCSAVAPS
jgi:hypothetical protein